MKKKILSGLLVIVCAINSALCCAISQPIEPLTSEEERALEALYMHDSNGTLIENLNMSHIDYYLRVLPQHITILEDRYKHSSDHNFLGGIFGTVYAGIAGHCGLPLYNKIQQLKTGNLDYVWIPKNMLESLRSIRFTRSEKKRLDQVTFKNINEKFYWNDKIYTATEKKKINYLGKRLALKDINMDILKYGALSTTFAICAILFFYDMYMEVTAEYIRKRCNEALDRDNRLIELLKNEKEQLKGNKI